MKIRNKKTGEIKEISENELYKYGLGGSLNKLGVKNSLWNNIRANRGSGKKPTKQMLEQERKIKASKEFGGTITGQSDLSFYKGKSHRDGGIMVNSKGVPSKKASAEVEGGETRFLNKDKAYIFSDKLVI